VAFFTSRAERGQGFLPTGTASRRASRSASEDLPNFSKDFLGISKFFQAFLWWFCGISMPYKGSKPIFDFSFFPRRAWPERGRAQAS
jgi:hypothetical protein